MHFPIRGTVDERFAAVRDVFRSNFYEGVDVGAALCVYLRGEVVVDLWGGYQDLELTIPWEADTLVNLYSTTKGIASLALAKAVEEGAFRYQDEVRALWPELRAARDGLTVGQLLSHQAGVPGLRERLQASDLYDWERMCDRLAREEPFWPPGTAAGYHAFTWGHLAGELVRRSTGRTLTQWLAEDVAGPLDADCYIGLPRLHHERAAPMIGINRARIPPDIAALAAIKMPDLYRVALQNPTIRPYQDASSDAWRDAEIPAANGHASARGVARIYGAAANGGGIDGVDVWHADTLDALTVEEWGEAPDLVLGRAMRRARGPILNTEQQYGPNAAAFGHAGAGGSLGFADPHAGIGFAYVMNQMQVNLDGDTRAGRLVNAIYKCL